jgi:hypothetical protein
MKQNILVLGDSHALVFQSGQFPLNFPKYNWEVQAIIGATISGLENPNAITQAMPKFKERLNKGGFDRLIIQMGEVDIGFVMWFKSQKYNEPVEGFFELCVSKYQEFLLILLTYCNDIFVVSTPLPTIKDDESLGKVANQRNSIKVSQKERTKFTLAFNQRIKDMSSILGVVYLDLDSASLEDNGLVAEKLINSNKSDHHYCKFAYSKMLVSELRDLLN